MSEFRFEKNLDHQTQAVNSTIKVFEGLEIERLRHLDKDLVNPVLKGEERYFQNIAAIQRHNQISSSESRTNIVDIVMETGTGKTYTYTKTLFELNKHFEIFKFVLLVPTLSIKSGTIDFLKSKSSRKHFQELYGKTIEVSVVESKKFRKASKNRLSPEIYHFVQSSDFDKKTLQVLLINAGMINSQSMQQYFDREIFDNCTVPFQAISAVKPFLILDEPHRFSQEKITWKNLKKMKPQYILRYGATFQKYENVIYSLSAVDAFNKDLVKGVTAHVTEYRRGKNVLLKLIGTDASQARFQLIQGKTTKTFTLSKKESLDKIQPEMKNVIIEQLSRSKVLLSNGLEMKKGDKIHPYSYSQTVQDIMVKTVVKNHFEIERYLLKRQPKIKPLTLFFIDNIEEYRNKNGSLRGTFEQCVEEEAKILLQCETDPFYRMLLKKTLSSVSQTHGGYFSKDNTEKDSLIQQEIREILHDKQSLLDLNNPRRFVFSKWTLREGWDNPNIFQICKLRSSGSEVSKLQELGRGLRLPVDQYGNRVKDESFDLNYFVDFTESDFVSRLLNEINAKADIFSVKRKKTSPCVSPNKVKSVTHQKKDHSIIEMRKEQKAKKFWEVSNEKIILEYQCDRESMFQILLTDFFRTQKDLCSTELFQQKKSKIKIKDDKAIKNNEKIILNKTNRYLSSMTYSEFLISLSQSLSVNIKTIHYSLVDSKIFINDCLHPSTIKMFKNNFKDHILRHSVNRVSVTQSGVHHCVYLTTVECEEKKLLEGHGVSGNEDFVWSVFFDKHCHEGGVEWTRDTEIEDIFIFRKIPQNFMEIPIFGGGRCSADCACFLRFKNGKKILHFLRLDSKNKDLFSSLGEKPIKMARQFFGERKKIHFKMGISNEKLSELIENIVMISRF